jgi:hypothetical protein
MWWTTYAWPAPRCAPERVPLSDLYPDGHRFAAAVVAAVPARWNRRKRGGQGVIWQRDRCARSRGSAVVDGVSTR